MEYPTVYFWGSVQSVLIVLDLFICFKHGGVSCKDPRVAEEYTFFRDSFNLTPVDLNEVGLYHSGIVTNTVYGLEIVRKFELLLMGSREGLDLLLGIALEERASYPSEEVVGLKLKYPDVILGNFLKYVQSYFNVHFFSAESNSILIAEEDVFPDPAQSFWNECLGRMSFMVCSEYQFNMDAMGQEKKIFLSILVTAMSEMEYSNIVETPFNVS